jgi:heme oxygenase
MLARMAHLMPHTESRLARLRARTRAAHAAIETVPAMARLLAEDVTMNEYVRVLQHMHAFHAAIEPAIAASLEGCPAAVALMDTSRCRALSEDLAWFGVPSIAPPSLPSLDRCEAALGALYVVEGSSLGGRVIFRHVSASLGVAAGTGGSFYGARSADAARTRWHAVCNLLESPVADLAPSPREGGAAPWIEEYVLATACGVFRCLEQWMRQIYSVAGPASAVMTQQGVRKGGTEPARWPAVAGVAT